MCNLSPHETEPNMHSRHDLRKKKKVWYLMICSENMTLISHPLPCAGTVCVCPWCHFGGVSLRQHGHSSLWVQIHILQHQQDRSTDQFQPDKRWVSGNVMSWSLQLVYWRCLINFCAILWFPTQQKRVTLRWGLISGDFCCVSTESGRGLFLSMRFSAFGKEKFPSLQ